MSEIKDIATLSSISVDLQTVKPDDFSQYTLFVEERNASDTPQETQYSLYRLFQAGIERIKETNSITIGEKIHSRSQIRLTNNYNKILDEFGEPKDATAIDYDGINALIRDLDEDKESFTKIWSWLSQWANFYVNPNPENADDSNLILTQAIKDKIQVVTESILNKIFRNLLQLIRVKHDYRLYGMGSTIFGGKSSELSSTQKLSTFSALPPSCWRQFNGNYIVGKSAYEEDISQISSTIKNTKYHIGPHTLFGIASHKHTVITSIGKVPSTVSVEHGAVSEINSKTEQIQPSTINGNDIYSSNAKKWSDAMDAAGAKPDGKYTAGIGETVSVNGAARWSYKWSSNGGKLKSGSNMVSDIFQHFDTILPTYASYVWQWVNDDTETTISSPSAFIR